MSKIRERILKLKENMGKEIIGQSEILERLLIGLLANGHLLVEGLPGLAKTRAIKALAGNIEGSYGRIQFTPDLVTGDITGRETVQKDEATDKTHFKFMPGPVFNNIVLADEINRAPSKTQNALLEAMEERQVTVAAVSHKMPELFLVMATQNPSNQHGTYPLPEAQMDRFLMQMMVHYPDEEAEAEIIRLVRSEQSQKEKKSSKKGGVKKDLLLQDEIFAARGEVDKMKVPDHVEQYMVDLIFITRYPQRINFELKSYIRLGASPRGSLALDRCARAYAWLKGKKEVGTDDVQAIMHAVLRHRITRSDRALEHNVTTDELIDDILKKTPVREAGAA